MINVTHTCDRCENLLDEIREGSVVKIFKPKSKRYKFLLKQIKPDDTSCCIRVGREFIPDVSDMALEYNYKFVTKKIELCNNCRKEFEQFMGYKIKVDNENKKKQMSN